MSTGTGFSAEVPSDMGRPPYSDYKYQTPVRSISLKHISLQAAATRWFCVQLASSLSHRTSLSSSQPIHDRIYVFRTALATCWRKQWLHERRDLTISKEWQQKPPLPVTHPVFSQVDNIVTIAAKEMSASSEVWNRRTKIIKLNLSKV